MVSQTVELLWKDAEPVSSACSGESGKDDLSVLYTLQVFLQEKENQLEAQEL